MKKLEDAVRRFGAPDHGRTAKRLRDFEASLITLAGSATIAKRDAITFGVQSREQQFGSEAHDKVIARQYSVIQNLQVLLNQKDEEIDMLRSAPPVRARDLWIATGLVSLVLLSAYYGFM